jgi:L-ribulose-5-phosphate 3-epimerase
MSKLKLGISLEMFGHPLRRALQDAARLSVDGVRLHSVGDLSPENLSQSGRRELRHLLKTHQLELSALGCPLRRGLDTAENLEPRIEHVKQVMALAFELGPRLVIVQAGQIPADEKDPRRILLKESLSALGAHGDKTGTILALDTGLEPGETLAKFLGEIDTGSLAVNFDPVNLFLNGFRPFEDLRALMGKIAHVHAKDARRAGTSRTAAEVPLGHGELDWMLLLASLEEQDYRGYVVLHRDGKPAANEIEQGVGFLRRIMG